METIPFIEYRCVCGKLLFKGVAITTPLQIKCRRCGALVPFGPEGSEDATARYGLLVDDDFAIKGVSESASAVLGYTREELLSMNASQLSPYVSAARGQLQKVRSLSDLPIAFDQAHRTKSGSVIAVRARVTRSMARARGMALYLFEVRSEPQEFLLKDSVPTGVVRQACVGEVDLAARYSFVSKDLSHYLGYDALHLLGANMFSLFVEGERTAQLKCFMEMARTQSAYSIANAALEDASGSVRTVTIWLVPVHRDDGLMRGYSVIFAQ